MYMYLSFENPGGWEKIKSFNFRSFMICTKSESSEFQRLSVEVGDEL